MQEDQRQILEMFVNVQFLGISVHLILVLQH